MDTDLSLLEIDQVDDALVEFKDERKSTTNTYIPDLDLDMDTSTIGFECSPLITDRSKHATHSSRFHPPEVVKDKGEPSCSSPTHSNSNKENLNVGSRSPSEDPQQIKRRKRGGGYNLRKSLAWNKAFFTEEGVLDPSELSRLSKPSVPLLSPSVRLLSSIREEGSTSRRKGSKVSFGGLDLLAVEKNLFKESPKKSTNGDQKIRDGLMPVIESSTGQDACPLPRAARKVQMTKDSSRIVSQGGGCPRPLGLSSQKRLPNSITLNGTVKDSKVPKRIVLKPESSAGAKSSKCSQKVPPVTTEKSIGLRRSSVSTQKPPGSTSSSFRASILRSGKNTTSLPKDKHLSTNLRPPRSTKGTISDLKLTPNPVHRADEPTATAGSEVTNSIVQNAHHIGGNIPNAQIQPSKPSGLRMPTPSLRYFDQPKSSASQSIQSLQIQSSNLRESGIPNPRKLSQSNHVGEPKSLHALADTVRLTKGSTGTSAVGVKDLSSTLRCLLPPAVTIGSHPTLKPQIEPKDLPVEAKASDSMSFSNQTNSQENSHEVHVDVDELGRKQEDVRSQAHDEVDQILHDVNQGLELKDNSLPLHTGSPAQFDVRSQAHDEVDQILHDVNQGLELKDNSLPLHTGSPAQFDVRSQAHDEVDQILHDVNQGLELKDNSLPLHTGSPAQFQKDTHLEKQEDTRNDAQVEVEQILDDINEGFEKDDSLTLHTGSPQQFKNVVHLENQEDARNHSHDEAEQILHDVNQRLELNDNSLLLHTGSPKQFIKDIHLENQEDVRNHLNDEVEQILHDVNQGLELNDNSLSLHTGSPEQSKTDILLEKQEDARNQAHDKVEQVLHDVNQGLELNENPSMVCTGSLEQCQIGNHLEKQQDARNDVYDEVEQISFDVNQGLEFIDNSLPVSIESPERLKKAIHLDMQEDARNCAQDEDEQVLHDVNQGLERNDNPLFVCTGSPEQFQKDNHLENIMDANLINEKFNGSESGYIHVPLSLNSQMQVEGVIGAHEVDHSCAEKAHLESLYTDMPIDVQDTIPSMQLGDEIANSGANTSMVHVECLRVAHSGKTEQLAELINPSTCELEQIDHMENHKILVPSSILVVQSGPSEESQEDNDLGNISVSPEIGCQIGASDVQSPVGYMRQLKEGSSRVDAMKKVLQAEDSQFEPLRNPSSSPDSIAGIELKDATNEDNPNCCSRTGEGVREQVEEQQNVGNPCPNENEIDLQESNYKLEMNDSSSRLQSTSSEALQKDSTLILQSRSFEEPLKSNDHENIIYEDMETTYTSGNPCESSHILCQLEPVMQVKEGDDGDDTKSKHLHVENAPLECLETDSLVENNESFFDSPKRNTLEHSAQGTMGFESSLKLGEDQTAGAVATYDFEALSCSTEKLPPSVQTTCQNSPHDLSNDHENIICEDMETTYTSGNPCESSHILFQLEPVMQVKEGDDVDDTKIKHPRVEDAPLECLETKSLVENYESFFDSPKRNTLEHSAQGTMGFESSLKLGEDQTAGAVATYDLEALFCSTEKLPPSVQTTCRNNPHGPGIEKNESQNFTSPEKNETSPTETSGIPDRELQSESEDCEFYVKSESATIPAKRKSPEVSTQDALTIKYKLNAVPFSDEWLAALEAAGEDILTLKTGAVQNSPPDKSVPEPSPWSPVKRNHHEIGPFDCTKCTNLPPPNLP